MSNEQPNNVIVNAPNSAPSSQQTTPEQVQAPIVQVSLNQAEEYGRMREAFTRAEIEAQQTRSELQLIRSQQESENQTTRAMMSEIQAQNQRLIQALEEEEEETQLPENSNGATIVTPPAIQIPTTQETPPKKKQSRLNKILFGKEDEE